MQAETVDRATIAVIETRLNLVESNVSRLESRLGGIEKESTEQALHRDYMQKAATEIRDTLGKMPTRADIETLGRGLKTLEKSTNDAISALAASTQKDLAAVDTDVRKNETTIKKIAERQEEHDRTLSYWKGKGVVITVVVTAAVTSGISVLLKAIVEKLAN